MPTPNEIRQKTFEKSAVFGYKCEQVEGYLSVVSAEMTELLDENEDLKKKMVFLAEKVEEYRKKEEGVKEAFLRAQETGDEVLNNSREKAEEVLNKAEESAQKIVESAEEKIKKEEENLKKLQTEVATFKNRLLALYKSHLTLITSMPSGDMSRGVSKEKNETDGEAEKKAKIAEIDEKIKAEAEEKKKAEEEAAAERESKILEKIADNTAYSVDDKVQDYKINDKPMLEFGEEFKMEEEF